ncbi:MAG TPA: OmpA family protein [Rhizomicrobium sp.]|jgi:outer membrane protein OmpA-like peptidoglycan-associated protein|nr:OmpA family protein [Rhizomicrobium sp.]
MKRVLAIAPLVLLVAACASRPHPVASVYVPPPQPERPRPVTPPPSGPRVVAPARVNSAGPLKTAQVSAYMDNQERDFRHALHRYQVVIARRGDTMVVNALNSAVFDGAQISRGGSDMLTTLAILLRRYDHSAINVAGYTDTAGDAGQNQQVSQKRARLVADKLAKEGVAQARLSAQGFGETGLRIRTAEDKNEPRNRRIEIRITPTPMG